jgi:hypothetical protein
MVVTEGFLISVDQAPLLIAKCTQDMQNLQPRCVHQSKTYISDPPPTHGRQGAVKPGPAHLVIGQLDNYLSMFRRDSGNQGSRA